ncbi:hypothetical protein G6F24_015334 [Rhizopus arrhizus]|nr:hypothetical protein G6F24_015334 [Rhizopus arrhizus]
MTGAAVDHDESRPWAGFFRLCWQPRRASALRDPFVDADHALQLPVALDAFPALRVARRPGPLLLAVCGQRLVANTQYAVLAQPVQLQGGRIPCRRSARVPGIGLQDLAAQGDIPGIGIAAEQASAQQQQGKHRHGTVLRRRESSVALPPVR